MQLTRLSRIETIPSPAPTLRNSPPSARPTLTLLARLITFTFLLLSTILILLALLLPNEHTALSSLTIKPIDKIYVPAPMVSASTSTPLSLPTGVWGQDESDYPHPKKSEKEVKTPLGSVTWFGIMGPQIWVGPMQICSKSDRNAEILCTSSSMPTFHARVLPLDLGEAMLALPQKPITPILLLVSGVCCILAIMVHALSISGRDWSCKRLRRFRKSDSRSSSELGKCSGESLDSGYFGETSSKSIMTASPHPAFLCLVLVAVVLSVAAAIVERRSVDRALKAWDRTTAAQIGLVASLGPLAHLIPLIPVLLSLGTLFTFIPNSRTTYDHAFPVGAEVRDRAEISGLFAHVTPSGKRLEDGRPVFAEISPGTPRHDCVREELPKIRVIHDKDEEMIKEGAGREVPRSGESCKTFGVGEAV